MRTSLTTLLHGKSKAGKSTIGGTSPKPRLILDAEGSTRFLPLKVKEWRPSVEPVPELDDTWDTALVVVRDIEDVVAAYEKINSNPHPFKSITLDSLTEIQRKLKEQIASGKQFKGYDHWGELLRRLDHLTRKFRDMREHPTYPVYTVTIVAETMMMEGEYVPKLEGGLRESLPYFFDIVGWVWMEDRIDSAGRPVFNEETGRTEKLSRMSTSATSPEFVAGERVQGRIPDTIDNPNISKMLVRIFPELKKEKK